MTRSLLPLCSRPVAIALAVQLLWAPTTHAAPGAEPSEAAIPDAPAEPVVSDAPAEPVELGDPLRGAEDLDPDAMVRAEQTAYRDWLAGTHRHDAGAFAEARALFERALATLPDERPYGRSRGALALWQARCLAHAYGETAELAWLDREDAVLRSYVARLAEIGTSANDRAHKRSLAETRLEEIRVERERVTADHGSVDDQLDKSLAGEYAGVQASTFAPAPSDLAWVPRADDPRAKARQAKDEEDALRKKELAEQSRARKRGVGMVAGGSALIGAGLAGFAVLAVGATKAARANDFDPAQTPDRRREQIGDGRTGNALAVAGMVSGGVLLVSGIVLVAIGARRMKRSPGAHARVSPTPGGVAITGRF